jgi:cardiolipin synthase
MLWIIGITVLATSLILIVLQNFKTPEKVLERKVEHRYAVSDPRFRREMSVLLAAESYSLARWQSRPLREKFSEKVLLPIRSQL